MDKQVIDFFEQIEIKEPNILQRESLPVSFFAPRNRMAHKGDFGHCLLIAGSYGKAGACVLSCLACLRTGCGLITTHIPQKLYDILQISVPEAMVSLDKEEKYFSHTPMDIEKYSAIAIGPGLGTEQQTKTELIHLLNKRKENPILQNIPLVLDADALNILAQEKNKEQFLKNNIILTPHPKEFERLFGKMTIKEQIDFTKTFCKKNNITIVIKGGVSTIIDNKGEVFFNILGNPGMATAGSGDVLTGIILGVLSQGYSCEQSAKIGVFIHALAGDKAKEVLGEKSLIARDIIKYLPIAIKKKN
ncbi:MAG: NAD(P)H-hydrate dehydratase [Bacteroidota bacterium]|nr:NAD(P)H-hydrate dehydratase [Bacteroidota bacterium]